MAKTVTKKERLIAKIDSFIKSASHECTMSGNIDAKRYLNKLKNWVNKNI